MIKTLLLISIESIVFFITFYMTINVDKDYKDLKIKKKEIMLAVLEVILSGSIFYQLRADIVYGVFFSFGCGLLLSAAILDKATTLIPDWIYYLSSLFFGAIICNGFVQKTGYNLMLIIELAIFIILQLFVFSRTFGFSDALAFSVFGLSCFALGLGWETMMTGMILSYFILIIVQLFKRNINRKMRLKKPVPFIPYIFASYCLTVGFALFLRG